MYKLSERQKKILDVLPEMTSDDAFKYIEWINNELKAQSRSYKKSLMDKEPFAKSIARELKCNVSTLKHDLDRVSDGTHKSLLEIGLVEKIQLDEHNSKSPNFYYKIKNEGNAFVHQESNVQDGKIKFAHSLNSSIVKQKIIIDLLLYANIIINERGIHALKIFCDNYKDNIDVEDYNHINTLLESFFNHIDYDEHTISLTRASSSDIMQMMDFKQEILNKLKNNDTLSHDPEETKICTSKKTTETSSNEKQSKNKKVNEKCTILHIEKSKFKEILEEKNIDVEIAQKVYAHLTSGAKTLQELRNFVSEGIDPEDFNNETTPLKIDTHVNKLYMEDFIDVEHVDNKEVYVLQKRFEKLLSGDL